MTPGSMADALTRERSNNRWWRVTAVSAIGLCFVQTGWLLYEIKTEPLVEPYVVIMDDETRVLDTIRAKEWPPAGPMFAEVARRWLFAIRTKSPNDVVNDQLREEAKRYTNKQLYGQVTRMVNETAERLGNAGIEVSAVIKAAPERVTTDGSQGVVKLEWCERRYRQNGPAGDWAGMYATIGLQRQPPTNTGEIVANPSEIYVTSFNFLGTGKMGCAQQPDAEVAESRS